VVSVSGIHSDMPALSRVYDFTCCDVEPAVIGKQIKAKFDTRADYSAEYPAVDVTTRQ